MKVIKGKKEEIIALGEGVFLAIKFSNFYEGYYLSDAEIDSKGWHSQIAKNGISCKAIGPKRLEAKLGEFFAASGVTLEKYVDRSNCDVCFDTVTGRLRVQVGSEKIAQVEIKNIKRRVVIVDDSKTIRQLLRKILSTSANIEVIADFESPLEALEKIPTLRPDVITLDIHMPGMDGVQFVKSMMPRYPTPIVMISSISMEEGPLVLNALEAGAVDYIQKPSFDQIASVAPLIIEKIQIAASAKLQKQHVESNHKPISVLGKIDQSRIIAIGSSTGGTEALREVLISIPAGIPPIVIVQHIPAVFSKAFADRMNGLCAFKVSEAKDGEPLEPDHCYIAPGGFQMSIKRSSSGNHTLVITDSAPVNRHKPSVDVLFDSVATIFGKKAVGVILTGMGADGAKGLLNMRNSGAKTIGQNESTCVVYGMPQAAKKLGAVETELPLEEIAASILTELQRQRKVS